MLSCPNGACDWAIPKVRIAAHECYMCGTDLASVLDPQIYAKFAAARAACTTAKAAALPTPMGNAASTTAAPAAQAQATVDAPAAKPPWRVRSCIEKEKAILQALQEQADQQKLFCGGTVQKDLLSKIVKAEARIVELDSNSGGHAVDRLGDDANLKRL